MVDELDTEWVDNFLHEESQYNRFYRSVPETVAIHFLYVDRSGFYMWIGQVAYVQ